MMLKSLTHSTTTIRCDLVASNRQASVQCQHHIIEETSLCKDSPLKDRVISKIKINYRFLKRQTNISTTEGQFSFKMFTNKLEIVS